jgi:hypothetical protein
MLVCIVVPKVLVAVFITWTASTIVLHDSLTLFTLFTYAVPDLVGFARLTLREIFTDSTLTVQAFPYVFRITIVVIFAIVATRDFRIVEFGGTARRARFSSWVPISNAQTSLVLHQGKIRFASRAYRVAFTSCAILCATVLKICAPGDTLFSA